MTSITVVIKTQLIYPSSSFIYRIVMGSIRSRRIYLTILLIFDVFKLCVSEMEVKIVDGAYATPKQFPHAVFLSVNCNRDEWICGASILNQKIILTAAHCLEGCKFLRKDKINAFAGVVNYNSENAVVRCLADMIIHEGYDEDTVIHDIAIAIAKRDFPLNESIKKVIIPSKSPNILFGAVAGWGLTDEITQDTSPRLQFVEQRVQSRRICSAIGILQPGMFCAGSKNPKKAHPSEGDSGSAMVTRNGIQLGLVSFRDKYMPALLVYTNVTYYQGWITARSKQLYCASKYLNKNTCFYLSLLIS